MIAVDTSAIMAVALNEAAAETCMAVLEAEKVLLISSGTVAETLMVSQRRGVGREVGRLLDEFGFDVVAVTRASARRIAEAYARYGKGVHPAHLNFGDCFAYELASSRHCPLLYVGDDFSKTDVARVLQR